MNRIDEVFPGNYREISVENRVLGINGSPRKNGNSDTFMGALRKGITRSGIPFNSAELRDYRFNPCIGCEKCRKDKICTGHKDGLSFLYPMIMESRGLILISPTHNYNITAWMKAFIDRLYCFYDFETPRPGPWSSRLSGQNRKALVIGVCEQEKREDMGWTIEAMAKPLTALGFEVTEEIPVFGVFERSGIKNNAELLDRIYKLGADFAKQLSSGF